MMEICLVRENLSVTVSTFPLTKERATERLEETLRESGSLMTKTIKARVPDTAPAQSYLITADNVLQRCVRFSNAYGICPILMNDRFSGTFN